MVTPSITLGFNPQFRLGLISLILIGITVLTPRPVTAEDPQPLAELAGHLSAIATLGRASPTISIPAGWFSMGTNRIDDDPYGLGTQFDNTELPQRQVWLDAFAIDRDEVSIGEYLALLQQRHRQSPT